MVMGPSPRQGEGAPDAQMPYQRAQTVHIDEEPVDARGGDVSEAPEAEMESVLSEN